MPFGRISLVFQRYAWFNSGYKFMRQTTEAGFSGYDAPRAVFLRCPQAPDACHHGRYGPEGMLCVAVQKTADFPQLQFLAGRAVHPVVAQWQCLTVQTVGPRDSPVARYGDRRPCCAGRESSTCAVVEKTVVLPRLHCRGFRLEEQLINALMS